MHIKGEIVERAVEELSGFHPFFGITFLVCKQGHLPVGSEVHFPINNAEELFLKQYFHPDPDSSYYFQPFRTSGEGRWLSPKYPSWALRALAHAGRLQKHSSTHAGPICGVGRRRMLMHYLKNSSKTEAVRSRHFGWPSGSTETATGLTGAVRELLLKPYYANLQ